MTQSIPSYLQSSMKSAALNPRDVFSVRLMAANVSVNSCNFENCAVGASLSSYLLPINGCAATKFGCDDLVGSGVVGVGTIAAHCAAFDIDDSPHMLHVEDDIDDVKS